MSRRPQMSELLKRLLEQIESGRLEEATLTSQLLNSFCRDPSFCNAEALSAFQKARTLAIIQRSHLQCRLRSVAASRLYRSPLDTDRNTWQIDG
jgi:hypothetical protein